MIDEDRLRGLLRTGSSGAELDVDAALARSVARGRRRVRHRRGVAGSLLVVLATVAATLAIVRRDDSASRVTTASQDAVDSPLGSMRAAVHSGPFTARTTELISSSFTGTRQGLTAAVVLTYTGGEPTTVGSADSAQVLEGHPPLALATGLCTIEPSTLDHLCRGPAPATAIQPGAKTRIHMELFQATEVQPPPAGHYETTLTLPYGDGRFAELRLTFDLSAVAPFVPPDPNDPDAFMANARANRRHMGLPGDRASTQYAMDHPAADRALLGGFPGTEEEIALFSARDAVAAAMSALRAYSEIEGYRIDWVTDGEPVLLVTRDDADLRARVAAGLPPGTSFRTEPAWGQGATAQELALHLYDDGWLGTSGISISGSGGLNDGRHVVFVDTTRSPPDYAAQLHAHFGGLDVLVVEGRAGPIATPAAN